MRSRCYSFLYSSTLIPLIVVFAAIVLFAWWNWFHNALPSDVAMITRFNAHRAAFEQLVQGYRNNRPSRTLPSSVPYEHMPGVKALMRELGVYHIVEAQGAAGRWYPDSYSERTLQTLRALYVRPIDNLADENEVMQTLREEMPALSKLTRAPLRDVLDVARITEVIHIQLGNEERPYDRKPLLYFPNRIHKGYYYFPQVPRIERGRILKSSQSGYSPGQRVFNSLDDYPPNWKSGECVLKRIDSHWFIAMCRTA